MLMVTARSMVNDGALPAAFAALRAAGIPVGIGATKRPNLPVRIQGLAGNVSQPFFGTFVTVRDVADEVTYWADSWAVRRGNDTGYADAQIQRDPATCAVQLSDIARDHCGLYSKACEGIDVADVIGDACSDYAAWFQATFPRGWGNAYSADQSQLSPWSTTGSYNQNASTVQVPAYLLSPYVQAAAPNPSPTPTGGGPATAYSVPTGYVAPNTPAPTVAPTPSTPAPLRSSPGQMSNRRLAAA